MPRVFKRFVNPRVPEMTHFRVFVVAIPRRSRVAASELRRAMYLPSGLWLVILRDTSGQPCPPIAMLEFRWYTVNSGCGICGVRVEESVVPKQL